MTKHILFVEYNDSEKKYAQTRSNLCLVTCNSSKYNVRFTTNKYYYSSKSQTGATSADYSITITGTVSSTYGNLGSKVSTVTLTKVKDGTVEGDAISIPVNNGVFSYTTSISTTNYGVWSIVVTAPKDSYALEGSYSQEVYIGTITPTLTITSSDNTARVGKSITLYATCTDNTGNPITDKNIIFYRKNGTSADILATVKTNKIGQASTTVILNNVTKETYYVLSQAEGSYKEATSSSLVITVKAHTVKVTCNQNILYPGYKATFYITNEDGAPITTGTTVTVKISKKTNSTTSTVATYTLTTNAEGYIETPALNLTSDAIITVTVAKSLNYPKYTTTITVPYKSYLTSTDNVLTAVNNKTVMPYQRWTNLNNINVSDSYAQCGNSSKSIMIASRAGSRHTPAPLKITGFLDYLDLNKYAEKNKKWSNEYKVTSFKVAMRIRTRSYSSDSARISVAAPTLTVGSVSKVMTTNTSNSKLPYKTFGIVECTLKETEFKSSVDDLQALFITFPKNTSSNTGYIELDTINVTINYVPIQ